MQVEVLYLIGFFASPVLFFMMWSGSIDTERGDGGLDDPGNILFLLAAFLFPLVFLFMLITSNQKWASVTGLVLLFVGGLALFLFNRSQGGYHEKKKAEVRNIEAQFSEQEADFYRSDPEDFSLAGAPGLVENTTFTSLLRKGLSEDNRLVSTLTMYVDLYGTSCDPVSISGSSASNGQSPPDYVAAFECLRAKATYSRQFNLGDSEDVELLAGRLADPSVDSLLGEDLGEPWLMGSRIALSGESQIDLPAEVDRKVWIKKEDGSVEDISGPDWSTSLVATDSRGVEEYQSFGGLYLYGDNPIRFHVAVGMDRSSVGVDHLSLVGSLMGATTALGVS
jgi:hypothetical protein